MKKYLKSTNDKEKFYLYEFYQDEIGFFFFNSLKDDDSKVGNRRQICENEAIKLYEEKNIRIKARDKRGQVSVFNQLKWSSWVLIFSTRKISVLL